MSDTQIQYIDLRKWDHQRHMLKNAYAWINYWRDPEHFKNPNEGIRFSLDVEGFARHKEELDRWIADHKTITFQQELMDWIDKKQMSPSAFYKAAWMDRKLFSAMKTNVNYSPSKTTAVLCCLALQLELDEAESLLHKAGYELSDAKYWDLVIRYCLEYEHYDIDDVNAVLQLFGEKPIGI